MGFLSDVRRMWDEAAPERPMGRGETRRLNQRDLASFEQAIESRDAREARRPRDVAAVHRLLKFNNPVRYRQLMKDIEWAKKRLVKMGLTPEDVRFLL